MGIAGVLYLTSCARGGLDYSTKYTFRQDADFHSHNAECAAIVASRQLARFDNSFSLTLFEVIRGDVEDRRLLVASSCNDRLLARGTFRSPPISRPSSRFLDS